MLGVNGRTTKYPVERYLWDPRPYPIIEGTAEVYRLAIAREVLRWERASGGGHDPRAMPVAKNRGWLDESIAANELPGSIIPMAWKRLRPRRAH